MPPLAATEAEPSQAPKQETSFDEMTRFNGVGSVMVAMAEPMQPRLSVTVPM